LSGVVVERMCRVLRAVIDRSLVDLLPSTFSAGCRGSGTDAAES
jgi:hypothetical protein